MIKFHRKKICVENQTNKCISAFWQDNAALGLKLSLNKRPVQVAGTARQTKYSQTWQMPPLIFTEKPTFPHCARLRSLWIRLFSNLAVRFCTASRTAVHMLLFSVAFYSCRRVICALFVTEICSNIVQTMTAIIKKGVKQRLTEVSQRHAESAWLKLRRQIYEENENSNQNRGIFTIVAR